MFIAPTMSRVEDCAYRLLKSESRPLSIHELHTMMKVELRNTPSTRGLARQLAHSDRFRRVGFDTPTRWTLHDR